MTSKLVTFGKREIKAFNYSRYVSIPKMLLRNMNLDAGDFLEFLLDERGTCYLKPQKAPVADSEATMSETAGPEKQPTT